MTIYVVTWSADDSPDGYLRQYFSRKNEAVDFAKRIVKEEVDNCAMDNLAVELEATVHSITFKKPTSAKMMADFKNGVGLIYQLVGEANGVVTVRETEDDWIVDHKSTKWDERGAIWK